MKDSKKINIIIIGGPGSGKGTQSKKLSKKYNLKHISTGDILRKSNNKHIKEIISKGELIDDNTITNIVNEYLDNNFILDGFPRTINQANMLNTRIDLVLYIKVNEKECVRRILNRNEGRVDDNEEVAIKRYNDFISNTLPIVEFYKEKGILSEIDGECVIEEVYMNLCKVIDSKIK